MTSDHYQDRTAQVRAIGRARHWLERLTQLAHFENVVLRTSAPTRQERGGKAASDDRRQPPQD